MENKPNFETGEGLTIQNDTRNVVDKYRGLTVDEIKSDLNKSRHSFHIAVELPEFTSSVKNTGIAVVQ